MLNARGKVLTAALVWTGSAFEDSIQIRADLNGTITEIGRGIAKAGESLIDLGNKVFFCYLQHLCLTRK